MLERARGPHLTRMLATGRFPVLTKAVYEGMDVDAEASFATGRRRDAQLLPNASEAEGRTAQRA